MRRMDGKVALVTGASGGQGEAEARLFAAEGAAVVIADVLVEAGRALADELVAAGHRAVFVELDVADESRWTEVVEGIERDFGRLDVLVNNAGVSDRRGILDQDEQAFDRVLDINLWGPVVGMQACAPLMGRGGGGSIVNISSIAGLTGYDAAAYTASKWGLRGVTKSAALELSALGIRVNSVHPGAVLTPMLSNVAPEIIDNFVRVNADQRAGEPEEIAMTVLHLATDESSYTTGAEIVVDGGFVASGAHRSLALLTASYQEAAHD
ncbi:SDR family NAD(P)-dependent oxidoreductase [Aeromicrobium sp. P5_D10]